VGKNYTVIERGSVVVSTLDYGSLGRELKKERRAGKKGGEGEEMATTLICLVYKHEGANASRPYDR